MSEDIKELVKRLRHYYRDLTSHGAEDDLVGDDVILTAADALEAMAGEVEKVTKERDDLDANGIHTCHDNCTKHFCVMRRRMQAAEAERDRLKAALEGIERNADEATDLPLFRVQCRDFARKALGGYAS